MGAESAEPASTPSGAVFLSYASQDAEAVKRICTALRAAGIEVWFDQSELRGGDAWDRQIHKQIHDCVLFVPIISAHSDARREGYFRREWRLAVERAGDMAEDVPFLLPVVIDSTPDTTARVPDRFRDVQWSRLTDGQPSPAFIERVQRLLSPAPDHAPTAHLTTPSVSDATPGARRPVRGPSWSKPALWVTVAVVVFAGLAYFVVVRPGHRFADTFLSKYAASPPTPHAAPASAAPTTFNPPPHSVAVLPFVNMSGDKEQEYFSEGLTEELLNSLSRISELQVAARTSSFSFQGEHPDIATVAHKLNVASVLEGSVRRSGDTVRITAQLSNALTGYHLWSQSYDRDIGDVLKLQTEIATAVAGALKVTMLGDVAAKVEAGGTRNPAALDAYLRGLQAAFRIHDAKDLQTGIEYYAEAIRLDPNYALAFAGRSLAGGVYASLFAKGPAVREGFDQAHSDARKAIALAPELAEGHLALARFFESGALDFARASEEYQHAMALAPGSARVARNYGGFAVSMGQLDAGIAATRRSAALDPLNPLSHDYLGNALFDARRYEEAVAAYEMEGTLDPDQPSAYAGRGLSYYMLGNLQGARAACEIKPDDADSRVCLAVTYDKLGRHADAEAVFAKYRATIGDAAAYRYAEIYAQWDNHSKALDWLNTALRLRNSGLVLLRVDPLLDPLRNESRFQAIERELKFPN
jgi:TolB-like protein/Tfp pilus assembly protein PilF